MKESKGLGMQGCWSKFIGNGGHHWPPSLLHAPQGLPGTLLTEALRNLHANAGDPGSISGLERSPGEGNGNPLQYSCLENPMDKGAWWAAVHGVTKSQD